MVDPLDFYDMVIDVNTLSRMKSIHNSDNYGWNVMFNKEGKQNYERSRGRDPEKNDEQHLEVGIIGNEGSGKTFVLSRITESQLPLGTKVNTKGISIKMPMINDTNFIFFDSGGLDSPIPLIPEMKEETFSEVIRDRDLTKDFLSSFVLHCSDMFIFVTKKFGYSEQEKLLRIKKSEQYLRPIIVVHNVFNLTSVEEVKEYIHHVLLSALKLEERAMEVEFSKDEENNSRFVEVYKRDEEDWRKEEIIHLVIASEGTEAGNYYNQSAFNYIRKIYSHIRARRKFDIIENLMYYYSIKSYEYMEEPIEVEEIKYNEIENKIYVDNDGKEIILKEFYLDELGILNFTGSTPVPRYEYCLSDGKNDFESNNDILKLKLELPGGSENNKINEVKVVRGNRWNLIFVKGEKKLPDFLNLPKEPYKSQTTFSNIQQGNFHFILKLPNSDYELKYTGELGENNWEKDEKGRTTGILNLTFNVLEDDKWGWCGDI